MSLNPPPTDESPRDNRLIWLAVATALLFLCGICLLGSFILLQQFQSRTGPAGAPTPILQIPTNPATVPATIAKATETPPPDLAATITPRPVPTIPLGPGNVEASRLTTPPTLDGQLNEWTDAATTYESSFLVHNVSDWNGSDDVTAVWRLGWDETYLYIGVTVDDDTHVQTRSDLLIFRGDSIDMQIDTDRAGDYGDGLSPDDFQFILSPGSETAAEVAYRFQGTSNGRIPEAPGHAVQMAATRSGNGYVIEAAIPWQDVATTPQAGLVLGLALNVNDNDTPETAVQEVMKSHISTRTLTNPTGWGTLTLLP